MTAHNSFTLTEAELDGLRKFLDRGGFLHSDDCLYGNNAYGPSFHGELRKVYPDNELKPPSTPTTTVEQLAQFAHDADVIVHDAQYLAGDMPHKHGWGHSLVEDVLKFGAIAKPKRLVLFHHDPDRSDSALDAMGRDANAWMKERGVATEVVMANEGLTWELPLE